MLTSLCFNLVAQDLFEPFKINDLKKHDFNSNIFQHNFTINQTSGGFSTSIDIKIPASMGGLKSIKLIYQSNNQANNGYGVGFDIGLPKIMFTQDLIYFLSGGSSVTKLIQSNGLVDQGIKNYLSNRLNIKITEIAEFIPTIQNDNSNFYRVVSQDSLKRWLQVNKGGIQVYDANGRLSTINNYSSEVVSLKWDQGVIKSISSRNSSVIFSYLSPSSDLKKFSHGAFHQIPLGLDTITLNSNGHPKKNLKFTYQSEYLIRAMWNDTKFPIFQASYSDKILKNQSEILESKLRFNERKKIIDNNLDSYKALPHPSSSKEYHREKYKLYVDVNGDGLEDILDFHHSKEVILEGFNLVSKNRSFRVLSGKHPDRAAKKLNEILDKATYHVYIANYDIKTRKIVYERNSELEKFFSEKKFRSKWFSQYYWPLSSSGPYFEFESNSQFFIDLNGDGNQEIIECKNSDYKKNKVAHQYYDLGREPGVGPHERYYSNLNMQIISFLSNGHSNLGSEVDFPFNNKAKPVERVFTLKKHSGSSDSVIALNDHKASRSSVNYRSYQLKEYDFECDQYSFFNDFNGDGYVDVITGKRLYLLGEAGKSIVLDLKKEDFKRFFSIEKQSEIKLSGTRFFLTNKRNGGKVDLIQGLGTYRDKIDGKVNYFYNGKRQVTYPQLKYMLLSRLDSPLDGGETTIKYERCISGICVTEVDRKDSLERFSYSNYVRNYYSLMQGWYTSVRKVLVNKTKNSIVREKQVSYSSLQSTNSISDNSWSSALIRPLEKSDYSESRNLEKTEKYSYEIFRSNNKSRAKYLPSEKSTIYPSGLTEKIIYSHSLDDRLRSVFAETQKMINGDVIISSSSDTKYDKIGCISDSKDTTIKGGIIEAIEKVYEDCKIKGYRKYLNGRKIAESSRLYDSQRRPIKVTNGLGISTSYLYSNSYQSQPSCISKAGSHQKINYDIFGNPAEVSLAPITSCSEDSNYLVRKFNSNNYVETVSTRYGNSEYLLSKINLPVCTEINGVCKFQNDIEFESSYAKHFIKLRSGGSEQINKYFLNQDQLVLDKKYFDYDGNVVKETMLVDGNARYSLDNKYDSFSKLKTTSINGVIEKQYKHAPGGYEEYAVSKNKTTEISRVFHNNQNVPISGAHFGNDFNYKSTPSGMLTEVTYDGGTLNYEYGTGSKVTKWSYSNAKSSFSDSKVISKNTNGYAVVTNSGRRYQYDFNSNLSDFSGSSNIVNKYVGGKIASSISQNGKHEIEEVYKYDLSGELEEKVIGKTKIVYERDENSRLINKKILYESQLVGQISFKYSKDGLYSIEGAIEEIKYHDKQVLKAASFINGMTLDISYLDYPTAYIDKMVFKSSNGEAQHISKYTYNNVKHLSSKSVFNSLVKLHQKKGGKISKVSREVLTKYGYEYNETDSSVRLKSVERDGKEINQKFSLFERDKFGNVIKIGRNKLTWKKGNLSKFKRFNLYFNQDDQLKSIYRSNKLILETLDDDTIRYKSKYITKVAAGNKLLGVFIDSKFYPVITDHLGSVVGMYSVNNEDLIWYRIYDEWGNKKVWNNRSFKNSKVLEKSVPWGYAGLLSVPELENLYFAKHRVYSPKIGEWLSPDPLVTWSPGDIIKQPGNWNPFEYAMGNPVNFIDTSGQSSMHAQFVRYMTAGIGDMAHVIHYHGLSALSFTRGVANSRFTGGGLRPSVNLGVVKMSGRFGSDVYKGAEGFFEGQFKGGQSNYTGQIGYSNGGLRALGRIERRFGSSAGGLTLGTSNNLRFKTELMGLGFQYNTDFSGRLDLDVMSFRGVNLGVYFNFNLTNSSLQFFNDASFYQDWSFQSLPYRGLSF